MTKPTLASVVVGDNSYIAIHNVNQPKWAYFDVLHICRDMNSSPQVAACNYGLIWRECCITDILIKPWALNILLIKTNTGIWELCVEIVS